MPTPEGNWFRRIVTGVNDAVVNNVAHALDWVRLTGNNPTETEALASSLGNLADPTLVQNKSTNFVESGYDPESGMSIPSPIKLVKDEANLSADDQRALTISLQAGNEANTRTENMKTWVANNPGADPATAPPNLIRHDLQGHSDEELAQAQAAINDNPVLVDMANRARAIGKGLPEIGNDPVWDYIGNDELAKVQATRPDYVPETDINGKPMQAFGPRNTNVYTGKSQITTSAIKDIAAHAEQFYTCASAQQDEAAANQSCRDGCRTRILTVRQWWWIG